MANHWLIKIEESCVPQPYFFGWLTNWFTIDDYSSYSLSWSRLGSCLGRLCASWLAQVGRATLLPFLFCLIFVLTLLRRWLSRSRIASSSLPSAATSHHTHQPAPLPHLLSIDCYRLCSLVHSFFLHNMAGYFGLFIRLHTFATYNAWAICLVLPILLSFVALQH